MIDYTLIYKCNCCGENFRIPTSSNICTKSIDRALLESIFTDSRKHEYHVCGMASTYGIGELVGVEKIRFEFSDSI